MPVRSRPAVLAAALTATTIVAAGVVITTRQDHGHGDSPPATVSVRAATRPVETIPADPAEAALGVSRRLFTSARTVVLVDPADPQALGTGVDIAGSLRAPILVDGPGAAEEIDRLGARDVVTIGDTHSVNTARSVPVATGRPVPVEPAAARKAVTAMSLPTGSQQTVDTVLVVRSKAASAAAVANAGSAGAHVVEIESGDPRRAPAAAKDLAARPDSPVIAVGVPRDFAYTLAAVRRGAEQASGGYLALPGRHYTAMYGHPGAPSLGVLGEQGVKASIARVKRLAKKYRAVSDARFVPTFEIIATVAAGSAGKDKNYSSEAPISRLEPLVDAAEKAGVYVILDLQPGRTDFLTQAKRYRALLERPDVGLALDPEWRLGKKQKHLRQIGSVSAAEINRTSAWLAGVTREKTLPQKLFVVHQFTTSMIKNRHRLDTSHAELATVIHVDGSGSQPDKQGTWKLLHQNPPRGLAGWGWKNFVDEDAPMLTARQTWSKVRPLPDLVTYQ